MWELDVALSADGVPFLVHDDSLTRTSDVADRFPDRASAEAYTFTMAEIQQLDFGTWFIHNDPFDTIQAGQVSQADLDSYIDLKAPTLVEALIFTRDHNWQVNVEVKSLNGKPGDHEIVETVVTLIEDLNMLEQVVVSSFNFSYISHAKALNPTLSTGILTDKAVKHPLALLRQLDAQAYHPYFTQIDSLTVITLQQAGFQVNTWTVNAVDDIQTLLEMGVDGIITDYPQFLRSFF